MRRPPDAWGLVRRFAEAGWHPDDLARLTIPQVLAMGSDRPPGEPRAPQNFAEFQAMRAEQRERENSW